MENSFKEFIFNHESSDVLGSFWLNESEKKSFIDKSGDLIGSYGKPIFKSRKEHFDKMSKDEKIKNQHPKEFISDYNKYSTEHSRESNKFNVSDIAEKLTGNFSDKEILLLAAKSISDSIKGITKGSINSKLSRIYLGGIMLKFIDKVEKLKVEIMDVSKPKIERAVLFDRFARELMVLDIYTTKLGALDRMFRNDTPNFYNDAFLSYILHDFYTAINIETKHSPKASNLIKSAAIEFEESLKKEVQSEKKSEDSTDKGE